MLREQIIKELKNIYDPEIPVNIWDLGLIYNIEEFDNNVKITMTFTSPTCPMMEELLTEIKEKIEKIIGERNLIIDLTWEPSWDISKMSESARIELDLTNEGW